MRVATGQFSDLTDERLRYCQQLGVSGVVLNTPKIPGHKKWEYQHLVQLRTRCESYGLKLESVENTPIGFYDKAILGLPGRDEQIENYQETIRNIGRAGIPVLGYHWMANGVWRTTWAPVARGGAEVSVFHGEELENVPNTHEREYTESEIWDNYIYFMKAVLPVAEEFGVRLALHPDDPPVPMLGGIPRIFRNFEGFQKATELFPTSASGLDFCLGTWSEMGSGLVDKLRYFVEKGKVIYVHFRDVQGYVPHFQECFLGEGNYDPVQVMLTLKTAGFTGFIIDDHVPKMVGDEGWADRGRAHAIGYLMGMLKAIDQMDSVKSQVD